MSSEACGVNGEMGSNQKEYGGGDRISNDCIPWLPIIEIHL